MTTSIALRGSKCDKKTMNLIVVAYLSKLRMYTEKLTGMCLFQFVIFGRSELNFYCPGIINYNNKE